MKTKIQKWGDSLGLRIPKSFAAEAKVEEGTPVNISVSKGRLILEPIKKSEYRLEDLLNQMTKTNIHAEVSTGPRKGKEAW